MEGKRAKGKREFEKFKKGEKLTYKQAVLAKCYECMAGMMMVRWIAAERVALYSPSTPTKDSSFYHDFVIKTA